MSVLDLIPKKKKVVKGAAFRPVEVPRYAPELIPSPHPVPPRLAQKLENLGRKFRRVRQGERLAQYVSTAVMLLTAQMFLDWMVDLSFLVRAVILAADIWLLTHFVRRQLLPLFLRPPNLEACALMVEKHWPRLRGQAIAAVQFGQPRFTADSAELVHTLQQQAEARTATLDFGEIVPTRTLVRRGGIAAALLAIWIALLVLFAPGSLALLERVFLLPAKVPRKTEVICLSGNKIIPAGDSVLLEAEARGIVPSHGRVTLVDDSGRIQEITLDPEPDHRDRFSLKIDSVEQSLTYTITLNDGTSDTYEVKAVPRPNVTSIDCEQIYPAYTGLGSVKRTVGNLALLAGSQLKIHAVTNSKIVAASLKLAGLDKTLPLTIGGANGTELTGEIDIPATALTGFSIELTNQAGITSGDETQYRIDLIPDHPPTIQLTYPERLQELETLKAKPTIAFAASDDYGLAKVFLCYRIVPDQDAPTDPAAATQAVKKIEMDLGTGHPLNMKNRYEWDLSAIQPPVTEETTLEYWMEAEDANNDTGPGVTDSEHHTIKIVSGIEKKAEVMNRLMDSLSTITDISQNQEKINRDLGNVIQGKPTK
jgi:hypothetical protein